MFDINKEVKRLEQATLNCNHNKWILINREVQRITNTNTILMIDIRFCVKCNNIINNREVIYV